MDGKTRRKEELEEKKRELIEMIRAIDLKIKEKVEADTKRYRIEGGGTMREEEGLDLKDLTALRSSYKEELSAVEAALANHGKGFKRIISKLGRL